jgi:recombination protein RecA
LEDIKYWLPTGVSLLDWAIGRDGYPGGRVTEISALESVGKTMLALMACKNTQQRGGTAVYIDTEKGLNYQWAKSLGVDTDQLIYASPESVEQTLDIMEEAINQLIEDDMPSVMIVDSIGAFISEDSYEGKTFRKSSDALGRVQKKVGEFFRRPSLKKMSRSKIVLLMINQLKEDIGGASFFGKTYRTSGGCAVRFGADLRIWLTAKDKVKPKKPNFSSPGKFIEADIIKNKLFIPRLKAKFPLFYAKGVNDDIALVYYMWDNGVVERSGQSMVIFDEKYTKNSLYNTMQENREFAGTIKDMCRNYFYESTGLELTE